MPASIANLSREELEKTVQNLLRRLKQRDKELKDCEKQLSSIAETKPNDAEIQRDALLKEKALLEESYNRARQEREATEIQSQVRLNLSGMPTLNRAGNRRSIAAVDSEVGRE